MKIGQTIGIINMIGEPDYAGRVGKITHIDSLGQLHGTWGGCAIIPELDSFETTKTCCICGQEFFGHGNNADPIQPGGICCNHCNLLVIQERMMKK